MNISAASLTGNINAVKEKNSASSLDKSIGNFEKQKKFLQEEMKKIDESSDDFETKKRKKTELQNQLDELDEQLGKMKLEKLKEPPETIVTLTSEQLDSDENQPTGVPLASSQHFLSAVSGYSQMHTLNKVRTVELGKAHIAMAQGADPETAMAKVRDLDEKIYEKFGQIQKELNQSREEIAAKQTKQKEAQEKIQEEKPEKSQEKITSLTEKDNLAAIVSPEEPPEIEDYRPASSMSLDETRPDTPNQEISQSFKQHIINQYKKIDLWRI